MKIIVALVSTLVAGSALAKLPDVPAEEKAKQADAAAKTAWSDKVSLYQTCLVQDRVAEAYRRSVQASGGVILAPTGTPPCVDPGPYVSTITPTANKPLEASEAHSPPGAAVSPPSTQATAAEIAGGVKKKTPN